MGDFLCSFNEGSKEMKELLGGKGANLAEMTKMGLPVPFGFIVTTEACKKIFSDGNFIDGEMIKSLHEKIGELEAITGKKFGSGENPLLVSVRTSSVVNIPTMAAPVLNLGLNDKTVSGLAGQTGSMEFALDSYSRFLRTYGTVVRKIPTEYFNAAYETVKSRAFSNEEPSSREEILFDAVSDYKRIIFAKSGKAFPEEPYDQLTEAIGAMLGYWNSPATATYRELHEISKEIGVALVVQSMVFGNLNQSSCTGTVFTRNPETGKNEPFGQFMVQAQGNKVYLRDKQFLDIEEMESLFPDIYGQLSRIGTLLERQSKDMQEIEFTVENGKLYMLETKAGRRSPQAAVKIAAEMVDEKIINRAEAVMSIKASDINKLVLTEFGENRTIDREIINNFRLILEWADEFRTMGVRANVDTPEDAAVALKLGAEGIGLCRSEHMFFNEARMDDFVRMIIAETDAERNKALKSLKPYQKEDFKKIFDIMGDRPVTIRLLDPSLHMFLPHTESELKLLAKRLHLSSGKLAVKVMLLKEENPIMGKRGSRLAVSYPEIARMQTEAIVEAAIELKRENERELDISIMIPFVSTAREFANVRQTVEEAAQNCLKSLDSELEYSVGTMIETPRAALLADKIAEKADFFSFGTNDLTQLVYGFSREDTESLIDDYVKKEILDKDPFTSIDRQGVGELINLAVKQGRRVKPKLRIGLCGEHGGDAETIAFCGDIKLNYVSCSTLRIPGARLAAAQAELGTVEKNR